MDDYTLNDYVNSVVSSLGDSAFNYVAAKFGGDGYALLAAGLDCFEAVSTGASEHRENKEFALELLEMDEKGEVADAYNLSYIVVESENEDVIPSTIEFYANAFTEPTINEYIETIEKENLNYELPTLESILKDYNGCHEELKRMLYNDPFIATTLERKSDSIRITGE